MATSESYAEKEVWGGGGGGGQFRPIKKRVYNEAKKDNNVKERSFHDGRGGGNIF